ncbi:MAG: winged helix-turn-helix transcriptional regulator [Gammaproteobacteria bacterium]|nr:winged helix-turn-helix transcriptional regulator [Gammaproteobacteria bacterium]
MLEQYTPKLSHQDTFPPESLKREINRLYVLSNLFHRLFRVKIELKDGVTMIEWKIIEAIFLCKGVTASDIIDFWGLDKTAVSRSIMRLEKIGILKRKISQADRRRYHLFITAKGRRMFIKLQNFKEYLFQDIEKHLSAGELHQIGDTAEKMIDHLRKMLGESGA